MRPESPPAVPDAEPDSDADAGTRRGSSGALQGALLARAAAVVWTVLLVAGLLLPADILPFALPSWLPWPRGVEGPSLLDKQIHFVLFLVETVLLLRPGVLGDAPDRGWRRAAGLSLALAFLTELLQAPVPTRSADVADLIANLAGVGVGLYLGRTRQTR